MPLVNYCKKCKAEVPLGESCMYCGTRLAKTGEQLSFGVVRSPVREWFAWNSLLRIVLPVLAMVLVFVIAAEAAMGGINAVTALLSQGFLGTMLMLLGGALALLFVLLKVQGREHVHVVLDQAGVQVRVYIPAGYTAGVYARFATPDALERLAASDSRPALDNLMLVKRILLPWMQVRRVHIWREGSVILFFHPAFWQVAAVRCPSAELAEAEAFVRQKLKRSKKVKIHPVEKAEKKKKR